MANPASIRIGVGLACASARTGDSSPGNSYRRFPWNRIGTQSPAIRERKSAASKPASIAQTAIVFPRSCHPWHTHQYPHRPHKIRQHKKTAPTLVYRHSASVTASAALFPTRRSAPVPAQYKTGTAWLWTCSSGVMRA